MFLTPKQIAELTGKSQRAAQVRVLRFMGIEHRMRPDGSIALLTAHIEKVMDGPAGTAKLSNEWRPDFGDINNVPLQTKP